MGSATAAWRKSGPVIRWGVDLRWSTGSRVGERLRRFYQLQAAKILTQACGAAIDERMLQTWSQAWWDSVRDDVRGQIPTIHEETHGEPESDADANALRRRYRDAVAYAVRSIRIAYFDWARVREDVVERLTDAIESLHS